MLNWSTASELNNKGFEIEKSSVKGHWSLVGFVEGHGTTSEHQDYSFTDSSLERGKYSYRLKQIDYDGSFKYSQEIEVDLSSPLRYSLEQNFPNPFNSMTNIKYTIPQSGSVTLIVYDLLGREVTTLLDRYQQAGSYDVIFQADELPSGIYFYTITSGNFIDTKKLILLK